MKKDWKYFLYLGIAVAIFAIVRLLAPSPYNQTVTYSKDDENPFGGYVLGELLDNLFSNDSIHHSYSTPYEFEKDLEDGHNILIIAESFGPSDADVDVLLNHVSRGGHMFVSAQNFYGTFGDTLKLVEDSDYIWEQHSSRTYTDSSYVKFVNASHDTTAHYNFRYDQVFSYFKAFDSTRTAVIARNNLGKPVALRITWGEGAIIVNSTPIAFTNVYMVLGDNAKLISGFLSYLPENDIHWTEYFQVGRRETQTPLRFILKEKSLRWAYFITIISILVYMIFEMKRRQRIIPLQDPMKNTTLEFVSTIGNLYYANGQHKNIAEKKILFFLDYVRTKFALSTTQMNENFLQSLVKKSGKPEGDVRRLVQKIVDIKRNYEIAAIDLVELDEMMASFYGHTEKENT